MWKGMLNLLLGCVAVLCLSLRGAEGVCVLWAVVVAAD